jgi:hypothetical protein
MGKKIAHRFDARASPANRMAQERLKSGRRCAPRPRAIPKQDERMLAPHANETAVRLGGSRREEISTATNWPLPEVSEGDGVAQVRNRRNAVLPGRPRLPLQDVS